MAEERFNQSVLCKVTYDDIVGVRGCTFGRDATLCEGECGERAQMISCLCQDEVNVVV